MKIRLMKRQQFFIVAFTILFPSFCFAGEPKRETRSSEQQDGTIQSPEGNFRVKIDAKSRRVDVVRDQQKGKLPYLRLRILRKDDRPLEVRLHLTEKKEDHFSGHARGWNGSMIGFELEWSFDKKTWKKLGRRLNGLLP